MCVFEGSPIASTISNFKRPFFRLRFSRSGATIQLNEYSPLSITYFITLLYPLPKNLINHPPDNAPSHLQVLSRPLWRFK